MSLAVGLVAGTGLGATVTSTADDGPGSLRAAISNAAPGETITFSIGTPAGDQLPIEEHHRRHHPHPPGPATITLTSGELVINKDLSIVGPGANLLAIQRSADTNTPAFRIFYHPSGTATISGLTLSNGKAVTGGAIRSFTTMVVRDCVITGNSAVEGGAYS